MENISKNKFEASLGKASGYFNVLKKRSSVPGADLIQTFVSVYPNYSLRWILLGEGSPLEEHKYADQYERQSVVVAENKEVYPPIRSEKHIIRDMILEGLKDPKVIKRIHEISNAPAKSFP